MVSNPDEPKKKRRKKEDAPTVEELRERLARLAEPIVEEAVEGDLHILGTNVAPKEEK
jgi:hypothetical protein